MDGNIARRLDLRQGNQYFDAKFAGMVQQTGKDYVDAGIRVLNNSIADFDAATDLVEMLQPVENATNFATIDRNSALCFRHPATFTQMLTLTVFVSQILFGGEQARSVEAQGEDDADKADDINAILAWNDAKISIYLQGLLWVWNALVYNRGIWYEDTDQDVQVTREPVEEDDISKPQVELMRKDGKGPVMRGGKPVMVFQKVQRMRNKRSRSGFFNCVNLVSPYDFICDPAQPVKDFQKGRYAGHRVRITWFELKRRSELEPTDPDYVLPHVVMKIKNTGQNAVTPAPLGGAVGLNTSRTYYERTLRGGGITGGGIGGSGVGAGPGTDGVNKQDGGTVECFELFIRSKPETLLMYPDEEFEIIKLFITSSGEVLSLNVQPNTHDEYPYAVAEGKPNGQRQFSPGWGLACKPIQDRIDNLNNTHAKAQARMGIILIVDDTKCDVSNLLSPDKNGLMIMRKKEGNGAPIDDLVSQIPLTDTTSKYNEEMAMWEKTMETMTGANSYTQGETEDPSQTLGQFDATKIMATGRVSSIARLLSEQGVVPQTRRFVMNFQQFGSDEMMIRIMGKGKDYDPNNPRPRYKVIKKADIQGQFDIIPHDGSLPGADSKIVAAAARTIEAYAGNPALAAAFDTTQPGAIDPLKVFQDLLKKSGLPVEKYAVSLQEAQENAQKALAAQGIVQPGMPGAPVTGSTLTNGAAPPVPIDPNGMPSAAQLPANPTAAPPMLNGRTT